MTPVSVHIGPHQSYNTGVQHPFSVITLLAVLVTFIGVMFNSRVLILTHEGVVIVEHQPVYPKFLHTVY